MNWDSQVHIVLEVLIAIILGGVIGIERELAKKPAGLRTHMLVSGASAFFVSLGDIIVLQFASSPASHLVGSDPTRIIQAIVVGISFLGAGTIIQRRQEERIEGLTTAASILFTSAIGISVALGLLYAAMGITVLVLITNYGLKFIEMWIKSKFDDT